MARITLLPVLLILPSLLVGSAAAKSKGENLASQPIDTKTQYGSNTTEINHPKGWYETGICAGQYCVFSNQEVAHGRGIALVTNAQSLEFMKRKTPAFDQSSPNAYTAPDLLQQSKSGDGLVAKKTLKRGTQLMSFTPVLLVHFGFLQADDISNAQKNRLLSAAVSHLPKPMRQRFAALQHPKSGGKTRTIKDVIQTHPFEVSLGSEITTPSGSSGREAHLAFFPEVTFTHDCRPNAVARMDEHFVHHSAVVRKVAAGEEVTVSYVDALLPRQERQMQLQKLFGRKCTCAKCTGGGNLAKISDADTTMDELLAMRMTLDNPFDNSGPPVTIKQLYRFLKLWEEDGLHSRLAEGYWLAAQGFNSLGYDKQAATYANRAAHAAMIEQGANSNDAIMMRVLAKDPTGHYTYRSAVKGQEKQTRYDTPGGRVVEFG
jgi:hypothetical protein